MAGSQQMSRSNLFRNISKGTDKLLHKQGHEGASLARSSQLVEALTSWNTNQPFSNCSDDLVASRRPISAVFATHGARCITLCSHRTSVCFSLFEHVEFLDGLDFVWMIWMIWMFETC